ncbi:MAG: elongation factor P [Candidatus Brocadiia bacterium]|nr:elongation factor P [Candidatus Brocadiia bacterium]
MPETISFSELRRGLNLEMDGDVYQVVEYKHVYMQQRAPTLTLKVRQLRTGKTFDRNMPGTQRLTLADVDPREAQYIYNDGQSFVFMDTDTFEQFPVTTDQLGEQAKYLTEGDTIQILFYKGDPVTIDLPMTVDLEVAETAPAFKGDTAQAGRKPATLTTGLVVKVPMHITAGQTVRVDTRTGDYVQLVS